MRTAFTILLLSAALSLQAYGAEEGKLSGKAYFSYNHDFSNRGGSANGQTNGFNFTRIYLGYDKNLDDTFSIRFLMDVENTKDGNNKTAWRPFMKNAYLAMNCKLVPGAKWYFGMVGMPFVSVPESQWAYRSIAKMAMDNKDWGSTADLGVGWKGMWKDMFQVEFALANGAGYKNPEGDMFKLVEVRPAVFLLEKALTLSAFGSFETQSDSNQTTIFEMTAGYDHKFFRVGGEFGIRTETKQYVEAQTGSVKDRTGQIVSLWGLGKASKKLTVLARYDMYDPDTNVDKDGSALIIAGLDYHPIKSVRFIPNVQIQTSQADDDPATLTVDESKPTNTALMTFEYSW